MAKGEILTEVGTNELEIIEFHIDARADSGAIATNYFGINVAKVLEVIESPELKASSSAEHPCYLGTIPLRESILPVLDLSIWLEMERDRHPNEVILVTEFNRRITGFLVSGVTQIHRVAWSDVEPPNSYYARLGGNCVNGLVQLDEHMVLLLDLEKIIAELDPASMEDAMPEFGEEDDGRPLRALIAEDSTSMRRLLVQKLEAAGFEVETAGNGEAAWNRLQEIRAGTVAAGGTVFDVVDLVVTDIEMPSMDGYTLTRNIKSDPVLKALPVILFSSLITDDQRHKGQSVGADWQVSKPEFGALAGKAVDMIRRRRREAAPS